MADSGLRAVTRGRSLSKDLKPVPQTPIHTVMKHRVLGSLGLTWGIAIVVHGLVVGVHGATVGYKVGVVVAWVFGVWLVYVSGRTIIRELNKGTGPSPRAATPRVLGGRAHDDSSK